jgi:hypothetical protein
LTPAGLAVTAEKLNIGGVEKHTTPSVRGARICIFCGSGKLSKEHIWPSWANSLLAPKSPVNRIETRLAVSPGDTSPREVYRRDVPEPTIDKQIRIVCEPCNNGWMSRIEQACKDVITSLILGKPVTLDVISQRLVVNWAVLKLIVCEQNDPTNLVTTPEIRTAFKDGRTIPTRARVYIARCGQGGWESSVWRHADTIGARDQPRPGSMNVQAMTLGIGELLVHMVHSTTPVFEPALDHRKSGLVEQIWPTDKAVIIWPPKRRLTPAEASRIAHTLQRMNSIPGFDRLP